MPLYELTHESLTPIPRTTMSQQFFRERDDLQRLLKQSIRVLGEDLFVIAEEFSQWEDSKRRIDLLAIDREARLVVIELKRSEDGGHMDLQALRYAAMISTLTFQQAVSAHAKYLEDSSATGEAEALILDFLGDTERLKDFGKSVRIILVSPDFSKELTTAVLWLRESNVDIRCVRIRPYNLQERTLLEVDQIIPLREAQEYIVRVKEKQEEIRHASESNTDFTRYDLRVGEEFFPNLWKRKLMLQVVSSALQHGLTLEQLRSILPARKLIVVEGDLRGEEFLLAATAAKKADGYAFGPGRFFLEDSQLIRVDGKTCALSNQWSIKTLPVINQIISAVPQAAISYRETES